MSKDFILQIQKRVISLLRSNEKNTKISLSLLIKDTCSEVSRLVACWIISADPKAETMIAKGKDVLGRRNFCHDVLLVVKDNVVSIIDPTIWQIYPKKKSIYVGKTHSADTALEVLNKKYDGLWKISETITLDNYPKSEQEKLQKSIF
ncbi:MAG: hypothetical protein Q7R97_04405 [Candidatus Daviesbacteria bacterium]|nr:hypothetical protein [Candidatus Daviesbacteria bacterium]